MTWEIRQGDVLERLRLIEAGSFDAVLCDPPYGLDFMGKTWDHGVPGVEVWSELRRCLKPGAILLAFGGTRTHHRLMCAIEDAGFEIRDMLMWLYGSGFPKSLDLGKALDKHAGTAPASDGAKQFDGWGTALKPAYEPIILAMKPCVGTFAENALEHGLAGLNINGSRVETETRPWREARRNELSDESRNAYGKGLAGSKAIEDTSVGRWPANLILDKESAAALDEQSGTLTSGRLEPWHTDQGKILNTYSAYKGRAIPPQGFGGDSGGASRFFYTAKASPDERYGNNHPTVKPVDLCRYLATLILPPERATPRRLIVPFAGSGSEMLGALMAGWDEITGIEREQKYIDITERRLADHLPLLAQI